MIETQGIWARRYYALHGAGLLSAGVYLFMALSSDNTWMPVSHYLMSMALLWVIFIGAWRYAQHHTGVIIMWALIMRLIAFCDQPLYEDDFNRYQWDSYVFMQEGSPYDRTPQSYFSDESVPEAWAYLLSDVNNPEIPTIYGPVAQYVFIVSGYLGESSFYCAKFFIVIFELVALWMLSRRLHGRQLLLYAWMPLIIQELWFSAHTDALALPFLIGSVYAFSRQQTYRSAILLTIAICARSQLIVLAPLFLLYVRDVRQAVYHTGAALAVCCLLYGPFIVQGSACGLDVTWMFMQEWVFHSCVFETALWAFPEIYVRIGLMCVFIAYYLTLMRKISIRQSDNVSDFIAGLLLCMLLCGTCINGWYLVCMVPFIAQRVRVTTLGFCALMPLSYIHGISLQGDTYAPYEIPFYLLVCESVCLLAFLIVDFLMVKTSVTLGNTQA